MTGLATDSRLPSLFNQSVVDEDEQQQQQASIMSSIDQSLRDLNASLTDVVAKVHVLEERSQAGIDERKAMQKSLNALNASVNQMIGQLGIKEKKPWYAEPAFHLAVLTAVLLIIIGARELGEKNTGKLIDQAFPTATIR